MKNIVIILVLMLSLSAVATAEAPATKENSATDDFLSKTWDSFVRMTEEAGQNISNWATESGITEWAQDALTEINGWFDQSGITGWTRELSGKIQTFITENGPAIEAWLQQAGQDVTDAWNALTSPEGHTDAELQQAYQTITDALNEAGGQATKK